MYKAQGTIEYLVVVAIVIVIGLLVVGLSTTFLDSSKGINITSGKIIASTGPISITEVAADIEGDGLIHLQNNSGENLTITRITLGEVDNNFSQNFISGESYLFSLGELGDGCACIGNEGEIINCNLTITYTSANGLTKRTTIISIPVECDNNVQTPQIPITPSDQTPPVVALSSPIDENLDTDGSVSFSFTATDDSNIPSCELLLDGSGTGLTTTPTSGTGNIDYNIPTEGRYTWNIQCTDEYSNIGIGTARDINYENPYLIGNCLELQGIENDLSGGYTLVNDINCSETTTWDDLSGFTPIVSFSGSLDGNNFVVTNLYINRPTTTEVGLFASTSSDTNINNIGLEEADISGNYHVGALVGRHYSGRITNAYSTGSITAQNSYAGGLVGYINEGALVSQTYSSASVEANSEAGGLVGEVDGNLEVCYATGNVESNGGAGGLVGTIKYTGYVSNCYATGTVSPGVSANPSGGLSGSNYGEITNCYSIGTVNARVTAGGLTGVFGTISDTAYIKNSFAVGEPTGGTYEGGLAGGYSYEPIGTVVNSYWYNSEIVCCDLGVCDDCTKASAASDFYSSNHNVYDTDSPQWDFVDVWDSTCNGTGYPTLQWENIAVEDCRS